MYTGTTAVPRFSDGAHIAAAASGLKPSAALRLAGPGVGVAEIGELLDQLPVFRERHAVERDGYPVPPALRLRSSRGAGSEIWLG